MKHLFRSLVAAALLCTASTLFHAQAVHTTQLRTAVARGHAVFVARMDAAQTLQLDLVLPLRDPAGLEHFLADIYDPSSTSYRHYLTPAQFTARFGPTAEQYEAVLRFAKSYGLEVVGGSRDGMDVQVKGTVAAIETALHVSMRVYQHPTENRTFYAPDAEPTLDLPFNLWHISGLDNYSMPRPLYSTRESFAAAHGIASQAVVAHATTGSGPSASYLGSDMRAAYYGSGSLTGAGQNLGLLEFVGTNLNDVTTYYKNAGQTNSVPVWQISTDGISTTCNYSSGCDDTEQTLDITQALGMAPGLSSLVLYVGRSDTAILAAMTTHSPLPTTIGCSWGWTPVDPTALDPYFQKMAAQGQSFLAASGDNSTWSSSNPAWPADDAYVISVGGTDLVTASAGGAWASETAWASSSGGISTTKTAIPAWQQLSGVITSSNHASSTYRNGPDVSANANYTFYVCANQSACTANADGGTSFAAPMWAGYLALVNQQLTASGQSPAGFINPTIYAQNITSAYASNFHDITSGTSGSYSAVTGYDLVTGWGSPNSGLLAALTGGSTTPVPTFTIASASSALTVLQGSRGAVKITSTVSGGYNSPIVFSVSGAPTGVTLAFSPTSVTGTGSSTLTLTVASTAAAGTYTLTVKGTSVGLVRTASIVLTIATPPGFSVELSTTSATLMQGASTTATFSTSALNGFNSAVSLSASGAPAGVTFAFSPTSITGASSSTLTIKASATVVPGTYTVTVRGVSGTTAHTATLSLAVTYAPAFSIASSVKTLSIMQGTSSSLTATTTVVGGFNSVIALSASGVPAGATLSFSPATISAAGSSTVSIDINASAVATSSVITLRATSGSVVHSATFTLTVTPTPDFKLASPSSITIAQGASGHVSVTESVVSGFKSPVTFTASGAPTGVSLSFSPASLSGAGFSTLSFAVSASTPTGSYPITVTGSSGSITHTVKCTLIVSPAPNFAVATSTAALTVAHGSSARSTVTLSAVGGFHSVIGLTATGMPSGVTATFSPVSITGAGSSSLTLAVSSSAAAGSSNITVTATSGSIVHSIPVQITIPASASLSKRIHPAAPSTSTHRVPAPLAAQSNT